jgi:DNA-binding transcriptional MerR regulator
MSTDDSFYIGELAERAGASRETIRYYEREGVLPEPRRSGSGYRLYADEDVERLRFVARAQALGLKLDEIGRVLEIVDEGRKPCVHVRRTLEDRLAETRDRIRELRELEGRLERAFERAEELDPGDGRTCRCSIIENATTEVTEP